MTSRPCSSAWRGRWDFGFPIETSRGNARLAIPACTVAWAAGRSAAAPDPRRRASRRWARCGVDPGGCNRAPPRASRAPWSGRLAVVSGNVEPLHCERWTINCRPRTFERRPRCFFGSDGPWNSGLDTWSCNTWTSRVRGWTCAVRAPSYFCGGPQCEGHPLAPERLDGGGQRCDGLACFCNGGVPRSIPWSSIIGASRFNCGASRLRSR